MTFSIDVWNRATRSVEFVCPRCGLDRNGTVVVPGRWGCAFGKRVMPLGEHECMVMCDECGHTSDLGVLDIPTTSQLSALLRDATIAALVLAVRSVDTNDAVAAREVAGTALREAGFAAENAAFDTAIRDLTVDEAQRKLRLVSPELTAHGKQGFLHRVTAVVSITEPITPAQRDTLVSIGCGLGMAAPHINGILAVAAIAA